MVVVFACKRDGGGKVRESKESRPETENGGNFRRYLMHRKGRVRQVQGGPLAGREKRDGGSFVRRESI